jgi:hypothetical protein
MVGFIKNGFVSSLHFPADAKNVILSKSAV